MSHGGHEGRVPTEGLATGYYTSFCPLRSKENANSYGWCGKSCRNQPRSSLIPRGMRRLRTRNVTRKLETLASRSQHCLKRADCCTVRFVVPYRRPASGFADSLNGQRYRVAGDRADGASGRRRSDDRSSYRHAGGHPTAAAETGADGSCARVRRTPGYGVCNIQIGRASCRERV